MGFARSLALSLGLVFGAAPALADDLVVIAVTGKEAPLKAGAVFEKGRAIQIGAGTRITLLAQDGSIIKLEGPYSGPVTNGGQGRSLPQDEAWTKTLGKIAKVVTKDVDRTNVVGSSRAIGAKGKGEKGPDFWALTVDSSGNRCVRSSGVDMWRKDAKAAVKIDLRSKSARQKGVAWPSGQNRMPLPEKFIKDETLIVMKIDTQPRRFNLHVLPSSVKENDLGAVLQWLVESDCERQADLLINSIHASAEASGG